MKKWRGPIAFLNTPTGDGRVIHEITYRELPLTLRVQRMDDGGHSHAEPAGTIDLIRIDGDTVYAEGTFSATEAGVYTAQVVAEGTMRGVSIDPGEIVCHWVIRDTRDGTEYSWAEIEDMGRGEYEELVDYLEEVLVFDRYEIAAATVVATPAFAAARIEVVDDTETTDTEATDDAQRIAASAAAPLSVHSMIDLGRHANQGKDIPGMRLHAPVASPSVPQRFTASAGFTAPAEAFRKREFSGYERFTVDAATRTFFGHVYPWDAVHRGSPDGMAIRPPKTTDFRQFLTGGKLTLDNGATIDVGVITFLGGHYSTAEEYDRAREDPANQLGPAVLYADDFGVQACGIVWPDIDDVALARAAASYPSGDWMQRGGEWQLMGVALVNNPGFHAFDVEGVEPQRLVASYRPPLSALRHADDTPEVTAQPLSVSEKLRLLMLAAKFGRD